MAYQSAWDKWSSWCQRQQIDPVSCEIHFFVNFLAKLYKQGLQQCSINTIKSAVSMTQSQIEGIPIGQHPLVSRLTKGIYNCRPPQPRYTATWDVDIVIARILNLGVNSVLSLKQLSQKLVVLMVLVEASRTSKLALDIRYRVYKPKGVLFRLSTLTKKRKVGAPPREIFFRAYPPDEQLCVVEALKRYEARTNQYRKSGSSTEENRLFLSYVKPHRPVTSQRIAHSIKEGAGVDTSVF